MWQFRIFLAQWFMRRGGGTFLTFRCTQIYSSTCSNEENKWFVLCVVVSCNISTWTSLLDHFWNQQVLDGGSNLSHSDGWRNYGNRVKVSHDIIISCLMPNLRRNIVKSFQGPYQVCIHWIVFRKVPTRTKMRTFYSDGKENSHNNVDHGELKEWNMVTKITAHLKKITKLRTTLGHLYLGDKTTVLDHETLFEQILEFWLLYLLLVMIIQSLNSGWRSAFVL